MHLLYSPPDGLTLQRERAKELFSCILFSRLVYSVAVEADAVDAVLVPVLLLVPVVAAMAPESRGLIAIPIR